MSQISFDNLFIYSFFFSPSQSLEWNDELAEEPGGESPPVETEGIGASNSDKKDDNPGNAPEENEWDRLLRVR